MITLTHISGQYLAGSASGQDEANPVFWLATRAGKIGLSCPLGISRFVPAKEKFFGVTFWSYNKSFIHQACSVKIVGYWPRSIFAFLWTNAKKKELGQYPAMLTFRLVNNAYIFIPLK